MKKQPDLENYEDIEANLFKLFHQYNPDPAFIDRLDRRLAQLGPAQAEPPAWRRRLEEFFTASARSLAWGALAVALVVTLIWSINTLLPPALPLSRPTASNSPTLTLPAATPTAPPVTAAVPGLLGLDSPTREIRARLTHPAWSTLWVEGYSITYTGQAEGGQRDGQKEFLQAYLDGDGSGRAVSTGALSLDAPFSVDLEPSQAWASDGSGVVEYDFQTGLATPRTGGEPALHPLEREHPVLEMIFLPSQLMLLSSDVQVLREDTVAGRPALVVEWGGSRLWADAATGLLLRRQIYQGENLVSDAGVEKIVLNPDIPPALLSTDRLEASRFELPPSGAPGNAISTPGEAGEAVVTIKSEYQAVNIRSGPDVEAYPVIGTLAAGDQAPAVGKSPDEEWIQIEYPRAQEGVGWVFADLVDLTGAELPLAELPPTPTPAPVSNNLGQAIRLSVSGEPQAGLGSSGALYFMLNSRRAPFGYQLLGVDMDCLVNQGNCKASRVPGFPPENFSPTSGLSWAPDGKKAVLIDNNNHQLLLYRVREAKWETIAYQLFVTTAVTYWSPDGTWIAAATQSEDGSGSLVTIIPADGEQEDPSWRTFAEELGGQQIPVGWIDNQTLVFMRSWTPPKGTEGQAEPPRLYLLDIPSGEWDELPMELDGSQLKNYPAVAPGGKHIILDIEAEEKSGLAVLDTDMAQMVSLGVVGRDPVWSPNGEWIAFVAPQASTSFVYVMRPNGTGLIQLFEWAAYPLIAWAPDSAHLIVEAYPPTGAAEADRRTILLLVSVPDGSVREILLEEDNQQYEFRYPAFQPPAGR